MMVPSRRSVCETLVVSLLLSVLSWSQSSTPAASSPPKTQPASTTSAVGDSAQEAVVFDRIGTRLVYESDGSGTQESEVIAHIQSQAGLQNLAVLTFAYTSDNMTVDIEYVRVKKLDGAVVVTPEYNVQDMPGEVTRTAPMYSDLHEKHVTVKALAVGDSLEYKVRFRITKPQVPGQFWFQYDFMKLFPVKEEELVVKEEELVVNVPRDKYVQVESPD